MKIYVKLTFLNSVFGAIAAIPISVMKSGDNIGEYGDYFEGDMLLTKEQEQEIEDAKMPHDDKDDTPKNGLKFSYSRWPNKTVVYEIREENLNEDQIKMIKDALQDIEDKSCIKFRKRQNEKEPAVVIQRRRRDCYSSLGYTRNRNQVLNLGPGCFYHATIVHEMLHTLGFVHMQSTYDRDDYVTIQYENIQSGYESNFEKYRNSTITDFGVPYDYGSVMHYSETAFSKNGKKTIIPKKEGVTIGQRKGLSKSDILKMNRMYECPNKTANTEKESITDLNWLENIPIKP